MALASRPHVGHGCQRTATGQRAAFRPFSGRRPSVAVRAGGEDDAQAAAAEGAEGAGAAAAVDTDSFSFNLNEAKRGNSYEASDVKAALDFYASGGGDLPYEADFTVNRFGTEDAAFFDDIDDNEGYAASEYLSVGIEEAAPKTKQRGPADEDAAFDEAVEEFDQERAASAAFEGVEVLDDDLLDDTEDAPWTWDDGAPKAASATAGDAADEEGIMAALAALDFDEMRDEELETRELASMVVDALGDDLDLVGGEEGADVAPATELSEAEAAQMDAALALDAATAAAAPELPAALAAAIASVGADGLVPAGAAAAAPLAASDVDAYLARLRAIDAAAAGGAGGGLEGVRKEAASLAGAGAPAADVALPELAPELLAAGAPFEAAAEAVPGAGASAGERLAAAFEASLAELEAVGAEDYSNTALGSASLFPEEADLEAYEATVDGVVDYVEATAGMVDDALELDEDGALAGDDSALNPFDDLDDSLLARGAVLDFDGDDDANFQERILELSRVTKVVKGGKIMGFRAVVVVGDGAGRVGVGCQSGREVGTAVKRSLVDAKKNLVRVPLVGAGTLPHRSEAWFKAAGVVIVPASEGTGVIAGGAVRSVLELAGVQNVLAKRLGSRSMLNNARVTVKALEQLRTLDEVAATRDLPLQALLQ